MKESTKLIPELTGLIIAAGEAILKVYDSPFSVEYKEDNSPLTLADKLSHEIISTGLRKYSSYPVLSEEMVETPYNERKKWGAFWLVDPLDGTKEFVKRNGEFTVNIALVEGKSPIMGFIYLPVHKTLYYAAQNYGAYKITNVDQTSLKLPEDISKASVKLPLKNVEKKNFTIVASRSHNSPETEAFMEKEKKKHGAVDLISAGSSIKFCLVAEGKADAYPRYAPTMEWDSAAGQAIVEETGKKVVMTDGVTPLLYNKESLVNPHFLVN
jgi:3'(2'), 5'-bisphosphate nucleotidase